MIRFKGGVHPPTNKLTKDFAIEKSPLPKRVVLPVIQHIGAPAKVIVNKGDIVMSGQLVAEAGGYVSSPVHATISGLVTDIRDTYHPVLGKPVRSVMIESDGNDTKIVPQKTYSDYYRYSQKELAGVIAGSGIVGLGGAAFPTHVKLSPPKDVEINTLIINGAECEPYLTSDDALMKEYPKEIVEGTKILMHILKVHKAIIAVEDNKPEAIKVLKKFVFNEPNLDLAVLRTHYPQGAEKQLIKVISDLEVPSGGLPLNVGVVVHNVGTAYAVSRAINEGDNLISRIITVSGGAIREPKNIKVRIGTLISEIAEFSGGTKEDLVQIIMGGPMMGIAQASMDVPVIKGTSGLLFFNQEEAISRKYYDCFRCGKCVQACPMGLLPNMLSIASEHNLLEQSKLYFPQDCVECGSCAYVCPSSRPIVQQIKHIKSEILNQKKK